MTNSDALQKFDMALDQEFSEPPLFSEIWE